MKKGLTHTAIILLTIFVFFLLVSPIRRYIYWGHQHLGFSLGLNFNNIASTSYAEWISLQPDNFEVASRGIYLNKTVEFKDLVAQGGSKVLGESSAGEKWIEVDLSDQRLHMKEGTNTVGNFLVSTGKWSPTPKGEWRIWTKLRYTRMRGGSKALGTFYDLPNVPYTMYYYQGYGIHGAYWHNDFGRPRSHGCVNMKPEEAGIVFNWASVGTRVVVHE